MAAVRRARADVVVSVNIPDSLMAVGRLKARRGGGPKAVMAVHSIDAWSVDDARRWAAVLDGVVATNRLTCALMAEETRGTRTAVFYASYGVPLEPSPSRPRTRSGPIEIAFAGRLEVVQKRVLDLPGIMEAFDRRGVHWRLRVAGLGPAEDALRRQMARPWMNGSVEFLGFVPPGDLKASLYSDSDVLLVPSSWETGPIVIWEAMANGVAVVASRYLGSGREASLVSGENCLLFPIGDTEAAADCVARVSNDAIRETLVSGGRRLVERRYSPAISVGQWDDTLRAVLGAPPGPAGPAELLEVPPAGRLDRWLGTRTGEAVRKLCGVRFRHPGPGAEWPHSYSSAVDDERFLQWAADVDSREQRPL
jgi:glycosyltransferase involved in cell wall biosynthesis